MLSQKPWRVETVIMLLAGIFSCWFVGMLVVGFLHRAGVTGFNASDGPGIILMGTLGFQGVACLAMPVFFQLHGLDWRDALGLRQPRLGRLVGLGLLLLLLAIPLIMLVQKLTAVAFTQMGWPTDDQRAVELLLGAKSLGIRIYLVVFAAIIAPVAEEFIFRGVLFPYIRQLGWTRLAWVGVSLLFAGIHLNLPTMLPLFLLALLFTWLYEKTDCLLVPIAAHSLFNSVNLVMLFLAEHFNPHL